MSKISVIEERKEHWASSIEVFKVFGYFQLLYRSYMPRGSGYVGNGLHSLQEDGAKNVVVRCQGVPR